jgi:CubicO group peptidase (beta-lactamase class C family)
MADLYLERTVSLWVAIGVVAVLVASCTPVTPTPTLAPTPLPTQTPTLTATATQTPTSPPTPTPTATPTSTPTPTPTPIPWPTEGSTPEQQGMDSELLVGMFDYIEQQKVNVHSVLVVRHGYVVVEAYSPPYGRNIRHGTASCGKGITSALVGIAIREGYIDGVDQKVLDFFPTHSAAQSDPLKQSMTVEHLLTMTSGIDWPESSASYSSSRNIMNQMMRSQDWVRFVLDRPMAAQPGAVFNYSSGVSHLLSAIIQEATGTRTLSFARTHLFEPLGITRVYWPSDPHGIAFGAGGLWMTARDMAKIGQLYLQGGVWDGKQIVPAEWVEASIAQQVNAHGPAPYYGYQWWVRSNGTFAAHGYRGQRIFVVPDLEMVVVFTGDISGNAPSAILASFIVPAAQSPEPLPDNPQGVALLKARIGEFEQSEP